MKKFVCTPFHHTLLKAAKVKSTRHGSTINTDRFPKRAPKEQASSGVRGHAPLGNLIWILTPQSPVFWVCEHLDRISTDCPNHFPAFNLEIFFK